MFSTCHVMHHDAHVQNIIQEKVLNINDSAIKKSSMYLSVTSAIECYVQKDIDDSN